MSLKRKTTMPTIAAIHQAELIHKTTGVATTRIITITIVVPITILPPLSLSMIVASLVPIISVSSINR